jgi:hypothetical protein
MEKDNQKIKPNKYQQLLCGWEKTWSLSKCWLVLAQKILYQTTAKAKATASYLAKEKFNPHWLKINKLDVGDKFWPKKLQIINHDKSYAKKIKQLAFWNLAQLIFFVIKKAVKTILLIANMVGRLAILIINFFIKPFKFAKNFSAALMSKIKNKIKAAIKFVQEKLQSAPKDSDEKITILKPQTKLPPLKSILIFAIVLVMLILPIKIFTYYKDIKIIGGQVLGVSEEAISHLVAGGESAAQLSLTEASNDFSRAADNFFQAEQYLNNINSVLFKIAAISPDKDLRLAAVSKNIIKAGQYGAAAAQQTAEAINYLLYPSEESLTEKINKFNESAGAALINIKNIETEISVIKPEKLPSEYQETFKKIQNDIVVLSSGLNSFLNLTDSLADFLGSKQDKRYLLVFQNNAEMRASGGFIGSYAIIDFRQGKIKNLEVPGGGSYDTEAGLLTKVKAPAPLWLVNPLWHFWDANWWPHWPLSAEKLEWFLEKSDGPTVDGVIAITPTALEKIMEIFGAVDLQENYDLTITSENLWAELQTLAEQKPDQTKTPKKIIGDLMVKIIEELPQRINKELVSGLLNAMAESLSEKQILLYFNSLDLQQKIEKSGWSGEIKDTDWDYLSVINTNIAGGKSDKKIAETIKHTSEIMPNGSIINTLTITRTHNGIKNEPYVGVRNVDWMRIYVPPGSVLMEAHGFQPVNEIYFENPEDDWLDDPDVLTADAEIIDQATGTKIYNEFGKTVFANWSQVDPGQTTEIYLKYKLPFTLADICGIVGNIEIDTISGVLDILKPEQKKLQPYSLLIQKQPGSTNSTISSTLDFNNELDIIWKYPKELYVNQHGWNFTTTLNKDRLLSILLSK